LHIDESIVAPPIMHVESPEFDLLKKTLGISKETSDVIMSRVAKYGPGKEVPMIIY
jgi:hypothetical protein